MTLLASSDENSEILALIFDKNSLAYALKVDVQEIFDHLFAIFLIAILMLVDLFTDLD